MDDTDWDNAVEPWRKRTIQNLKETGLAWEKLKLDDISSALLEEIPCDWWGHHLGLMKMVFERIIKERGENAGESRPNL
jgi:hypothetical protein